MHLIKTLIYAGLGAPSRAARALEIRFNPSRRNRLPTDIDGQDDYIAIDRSVIQDLGEEEACPI
ncbi:MAG: hypothetical protein ACK5KM_06185 [Hyphomicrobiaceae bacterium]